MCIASVIIITRYADSDVIYDEKCFIILASRPNVIKKFTVVIYEYS